MIRGWEALNDNSHGRLDAINWGKQEYGSLVQGEVDIDVTDIMLTVIAVGVGVWSPCPIVWQAKGYSA